MKEGDRSDTSATFNIFPGKKTRGNAIDYNLEKPRARDPLNRKPLTL